VPGVELPASRQPWSGRCRNPSAVAEVAATAAHGAPDPGGAGAA
jgi:hypothetical protein